MMSDSETEVPVVDTTMDSALGGQSLWPDSSVFPTPPALLQPNTSTPAEDSNTVELVRP